MNFSEKLQQTLGKAIKDASNEEIYAALLNTVKEAAADKGRNISEKGRKVYYISAEFLIGKLLSNNLINLGVYDEVRELLAANGKDICEIEEVEPEPSLGNGGLGRLAACFLDSIATLGLEGDGIGLNYHLGLFKQVFENHKQKETPNPWIQNTSWLTDTGIGFDVPFKDFSLHSKLYDIDVTGYENGTNKLHLFDIESVNENIVGDGISFDKNDIRENLTLFLYPDDSDKQGELLRIYQQYFMVSNGAQFILKECEENSDSHITFSDEEISILWDNLYKVPYVDILLIQCYSGWRPQELGLIELKNIDFKNNTFIGGMVFHWRKLQRGYYFILCGGRGGYEERDNKRESRSIDCAA